MRQPAYRVALAASVFGYAVMTLTMSATPLAMLACGFGFADSATVIQAHIIAMFLPSFFTGHLIARFGVLPVIAAGGADRVRLRASSTWPASSFANFLIANMLVGLGWNFAYVGGSTLLTTTYAPAERAKVQASHDFTVYAATASAAALSGVLQAKAGWTVINLAALPLMAAVVGAALWLMARQRRVGAGAGRIANWVSLPWAIATTETSARSRHPALRGLKPPAEIIGWGLTAPARIGHNQGPPLEEPVADAFVRWRWRKAHTEAWKNAAPCRSSSCAWPAPRPPASAIASTCSSCSTPAATCRLRTWRSGGASASARPGSRADWPPKARLP